MAQGEGSTPPHGSQLGAAIPAADARPTDEADARGSGHTVDTLFRLSTARMRHAVIGAAAVATLVLGGISVALAVRAYDAAKHNALIGLQARVVAVGAVVDVAVAADIELLETAAAAPVVVNQHTASMDAYFGRFGKTGGAGFSGAIAWIASDGRVQAASTAALIRAHALVSGRLYFKQVMASGKPYVSTGIVGRLNKQPLIVIAVPTRAADGRLSGVLIGSILLRSGRQNSSALALGYSNLEVVDRDGHLLLNHLVPVTNRPLLTQIRRLGSSGVVADTAGFTGHGSDALAFSVAPVPDWIVVIIRSRAALFATALHALEIELAFIGAAVLAVLLALGFVGLRARRYGLGPSTRAWSTLTRALTAAESPPEVADALLVALSAIFPRALAVVAFDTDDGVQVVSAARRSSARELARDTATLEQIAGLGREGLRSVPAETVPTLRRSGSWPERRMRSVHALAIVDRRGEVAGTIAVLSSAERLGEGDWVLLSSFADQAGDALGRTQRFEHEHALAVRLQRSLLPSQLPEVDAVTLAAHYHAGGQGVEIGGDWYDAVRRPDGIIHVCVGDVSGRGIDAATVMGRLRNVFRAYAFECVAPASILRRMLRHAEDDEMVTVVCVTIDLYRGELYYSSAGHPPPLLLDHESAEPHWLDARGAPPIGVARPVDIVEGHVQLEGPATLALYTDGLVERRGASIDDGIALLGRVVADNPTATPDRILARISDTIGAPDDDVALVIMTLDHLRAPFEVTFDAQPAAVAEIRSRLRYWLESRRIDDEAAADLLLVVSEACNNAIEHGYRDAEGTVAVRIEIESDELRVAITDDGQWREPVASSDRGNGLRLMRVLMHSVEIESGRNGTSVRMVRRLVAESDALASLAPSGSAP